MAGSHLKCRPWRGPLMFAETGKDLSRIFAFVMPWLWGGLKWEMGQLQKVFCSITEIDFRWPKRIGLGEEIPILGHSGSCTVLEAALGGCVCCMLRRSWRWNCRNVTCTNKCWEPRLSEWFKFTCLLIRVLEQCYGGLKSLWFSFLDRGSFADVTKSW